MVWPKRKAKPRSPSRRKKSTKLIAEAKGQGRLTSSRRLRKQRNATIEASKADAKAAGEREKQMAADEIAQLSVKAREELHDRVADLAVAGAQRILKREINPWIHSICWRNSKAEL